MDRFWNKFFTVILEKSTQILNSLILKLFSSVWACLSADIAIVFLSSEIGWVGSLLLGLLQTLELLE